MLLSSGTVEDDIAQSYVFEAWFPPSRAEGWERGTVGVYRVPAVVADVLGAGDASLRSFSAQWSRSRVGKPARDLFSNAERKSGPDRSAGNSTCCWKCSLCTLGWTEPLL